MITISKEDYLKAIAEAEAEGQTVIPATLAHWLSVTRPAVTFALKRLTKDGLATLTSDGHIPHRHGGAGNVVPNGQLWNGRGTWDDPRHRHGKRYGIVCNCIDRERADDEWECHLYWQVGGGELSGGYELRVRAVERRTTPGCHMPSLRDWNGGAPVGRASIGHQSITGGVFASL